MLKVDIFERSSAAIGSWITLANPAIAEIMANAGFDWLAIDLEHSVVTIREAEELIRIIHLSNVIPLVRLTSNDTHLIKRVMDAGAHGVIVPMINNADDAVKAVQAVKYAPQGSRGVGLARAQKYGADFKGYCNWAETQPVIVAQIEHFEAVENFESIMTTPGISGFMIGPYDLSSSLGIPGDFEHADFKEAIDAINYQSEKLGAKGGIHIIEPNVEELADAVNKGYSFIAYSLDVRMLDVSCRNALEGVMRK